MLNPRDTFPVADENPKNLRHGPVSVSLAVKCSLACDRPVAGYLMAFSPPHPGQLLQGRGAPVDEADPLHHDEVRLLRAHRGVAVQVRRAQAPQRVLQGRAAGRHLHGRLHR